ncbi:MAG: ATP-binding cassette domain-containing protein [Actinobacteria bacterium]|nr:ATP-binding cassette domain-containing protein [Actinomycetota bacterium]
MLSIEDVTVRRGNKEVVRSFSLQVNPGEVTALLGANGAGKSSLVLALAGRLPVSGGAVTLDGAKINGLRPNRVRRAGLAAVPEGHKVLGSMTVHDNILAAILETHRESAIVDEVFEVFPELAGLSEQQAGAISGGQQQMLAIAQALASDPKYLLIDELSLGLAPIIVARLAPVLAEIAKGGVGVLLIEQFATVALAISRRAAVMDRGELAWLGEAVELADNPEVLHGVYLGGSVA